MATSNSFYCYVGDPVVTSATFTTPSSLPEELEYWTQNGVLDAIVSIAYIQNGDESCKTRVGHVIVTNSGSSDRWIKITNSNGNTTAAHKVAKEDGYFAATYNWETTWTKGQSQSVVDKPVVITWYTNSACTSVDRTWTFHIKGTIGAKTTYAVRYDGNGSTGGSTEQQTKYYNESLALRTNGFTKTNYTFTSWNTAASGGGTSYGSASSGGTYTANSAVTLYAQWSQVYASPQLSITKAYRCDADGVPDDEGEYAGIRCRFSIWDTGDNAVDTSPENLPTCTVGSWSATASSGDPSATKNTYSSTLTTSGDWKSGECWFVVGGNLQMENSYTATVTLKDTAGGGSMSQNYVTKTVLIATAYYTIDVLADNYLYNLTEDTGIVSGKTYYVLDGGVYSPVASEDLDASDLGSYYEANGPRPGHGICFGGVAKDEGFEVDFKEVRLHNAELSTDTFFLSKNLNVDRNVAFGIGSGGNNVGIWDYDLYKWIVYCARSTTAPYTYTTYVYDPVSNAYVNMGLQSTSTASDIASAAPGFTITGANYAQWGRVATVEISLRNSRAISSGNITNTTLATMKSGKLPKVAAPFTTGGTGPVVTGYINTNGNVILSATAASIAAATSGTTLTICATYVVA